VGSPLLALAALSAAACGLIVSPALFWTMPTALLAGAAAAGGIGLINALGNLGGFLGPFLEAGPARSARGQGFDAPGLELKREARQLEGVHIDALGDQLHGREVPDAGVQARGVVDQPGPCGPVLVNNRQRLIEALSDIRVQRHDASVPE